MVDPRLVSELSREPVHFIAGQPVHGQVRFSDQWADKHSFMFGEGASTSTLCPPGMMCQLDIRAYVRTCLCPSVFGYNRISP